MATKNQIAKAAMEKAGWKARGAHPKPQAGTGKPRGFTNAQLVKKATTKAAGNKSKSNIKYKQIAMKVVGAAGGDRYTVPRGYEAIAKKAILVAKQKKTAMQQHYRG